MVGSSSRKIWIEGLFSLGPLKWGMVRMGENSENLQYQSIVLRRWIPYVRPFRMRHPIHSASDVPWTYGTVKLVAWPVHGLLSKSIGEAATQPLRDGRFSQIVSRHLQRRNCTDQAIGLAVSSVQRVKGGKVDSGY